MFRSVMEPIIRELDTGLCIADIHNHWLCRCTVPGPGMRKAGGLLKARYDENGATGAEILPYPADDRTEFLNGHRNSLEWRGHSATLSIAAPESAARVICRYADEPLCLICNSHATPPEGVEAEVVVQRGSLAAAQVEPGQWAGKILFTDQFPSLVADAAAKAGAIGVISDCVCPPWLAQYPPIREPADVPDLVMWTIFGGRRGDPSLFGFNLSPRQGRRLRDLIAASSEPIRLHAHVDAELIEGSSDFVHAALPGTDLADEEVWVLAHLSEPGARDNASGCCLCVELARTLNELTASGALPPLRRTIRFMHAVEVEGFLPYIDANRDRLGKVVAGLCADSVGQDFGLCGGELVLFRSPEHNASFIDGLMETLLAAVAAEPVGRFSADSYATFPWHTEHFWGNDAFISDGFFDIPTPQLSTWPDKFYHSSLDTPDQMSPNTLGRVGAALGTYLYLLATAGAEEARWFAHLAAQDWKRRIARAASDLVAREAAPTGGECASQLRHLALQGIDAVTQCARFAPEDEALAGEIGWLCDEIDGFAERELEYCCRALGVCAPAGADAGADSPDSALVPRRLRWSAPALEAPPGGGRVWVWINGRRNVAEIHARLRHGGELPVEAIVAYVRALAEAGAVEFVG